jgi:hypothetical protein
MTLQVVGSFSTLDIVLEDFPVKFPIPMAARSKKWDWGLWLDGIVGWIPVKIDICLL